MSGSKVKGLLKGFRYISQIFENDKEQEMQIGNPTDVKHVAHIGWDGPSVNSPSWMNEFKSSPGFASPEVQNIGKNNGVKWAEGVRDLPDLPKASRKGVTDSREKSDKTRQSRKSSNKNLQLKESSNISMDSFSPARTPTDIPKKSRRKKSKENSTGGTSSKLRSKVQSSDSNVDSMPKSKDKQRSFEENESEINQ